MDEICADVVPTCKAAGTAKSCENGGRYTYWIATSSSKHHVAARADDDWKFGLGEQ